jgi:hypothetical protein
MNLVASQKVELFITTAERTSDLNNVLPLPATSFRLVSPGATLLDYALSRLRAY